MAEVLRQMIMAGDKVAQFREVAGDLEEAFVSAARVAEAERMGQPAVSAATPSLQAREVAR